MTTILIIEDDLAIRELMSDFLTIHGFDILEAENGEKGLTLAQQSLPDLIVCDIMMPKLDGFGVLTALQNQTRTAVIPFIFLTAKGEIKDMRKGMNLGADDYLIKPFSNNELLSAIDKRLQKKVMIQDKYKQQLEQLQEQVDYSLTHDSLTKLPNQLCLRYLFEKQIKKSRSDQKIPIISLSLDRFHWINQTFNYEIGDQVIQSAVQRIISQIDEETLLVRLNGVQFAIILNPSLDSSIIAKLAQKILDQFILPFFNCPQEIFLSLSLGIAIYPQDGQTLETLLQKADQVRRWVKEKGGNQFQFYQTIFPTQPEIGYLELESELRHAIEREQLTVYYQPQVNLKTHQIVGAEALLRWQHPTRGFISPAVFIPLAEITGLIEPIGKWVLETACQHNHQWQQKALGKIRVAVNLSGRQFNKPNMDKMLKNILSFFPLNREFLELEITESILVEDIANSIEKLHQIQTLGVTIAIDDFGTGYSSLSYLQQFPFNIVKIDQCFIRDIHENPKNAAITETLINMAHKLNLKVIAEGIETLEELAFLEEHHCDEGQGYLFSRPVPLKELNIY